jgi:Urm1 (Ubiquitin related modifier)
MKVKIEFFGTPEPLPDFEDKKEVQVDFSGSTIMDLLHHLCLGIGPKQKEIFLTDRGEIQPTLFVHINGKYSGRRNATLHDDDHIKLIFVSEG